MSSYYYVLILLYMCPHTTIYVLICVLILLYVSSYYYIRVRSLLHNMLLALQPAGKEDKTKKVPSQQGVATADREVDWMTFVERFRLATPHEELVLRELQVS
jgi:hypothetical protein